MSWNATGSSLAVVYGPRDLSGWCDVYATIISISSAPEIDTFTFCFYNIDFVNQAEGLSWCLHMEHERTRR